MEILNTHGIIICIVKYLKKKPPFFAIILVTYINKTEKVISIYANEIMYLYNKILKRSYILKDNLGAVYDLH